MHDDLVIVDEAHIIIDMKLLVTTSHVRVYPYLYNMTETTSINGHIILYEKRAINGNGI